MRFQWYAGGGGTPLPALANLVGAWYADAYSAAPSPYVPNDVFASSPASGSVILPKDRQFQLPGDWLASPFTFTYGGQLDPTGGTTANRLQCTAANNPNTQITRNMKAGTYTFSIKIKSNIASPPTMTFNADLSGANGFDNVFAITTSWQTFTFTQTYAASGSKAFNLFRNPGASVTMDINFIEMDFYLGAAPGTHADASAFGHMSIGRANNGTDTLVASGNVLDGSAGGGGLISFPAAQTWTEGTAIAIAKISGTAPYNGVLSDAEVYGRFTLGEWTTEAPGMHGFNLAGGGISSARGLGFNYLPIGARFNASVSDVLVDTATVARGAGLASFTGLQNLWVNGVNGFNGQGSAYAIQSVAMWNKSLTNAEYSAAVQVLKNRALSKSLSLTSISKYVVAEGDSITAGQGTNAYCHVAKTTAAFTGAVFGTDPAIAGSVVADLTTRAVFEDGFLTITPNAPKNIISVLIGRNDLPGVGVAPFLANLSAYLDARRAAGWKVLLCTILPSTATGFNALRNSANTTLRTWVGLHCDAICDFAADPTMGIDGNGTTTGPWSTTNYQDGTHPTQAGQNILAPIYAAAINAM